MDRDTILVLYGTDPARMVRRLMERAESLLPADRHAAIALKPNLVVPSPSTTGATTDPRIVDALLGWLRGHGYLNVSIMESSWVGERDTGYAFSVCGYTELSQKWEVPLIDLKKDKTRSMKAGELTIEVCERALDADFLINLPVLKGHCQTKMTCALKNLKGCIPDHEKRRFHRLGLHKPIAALGAVLRPNLTLVDGIIGDLHFEEGGTPVRMDRLILGADPVRVDAYVASLMGYAPEDIGYIPLAQVMGAGETGPTCVEELNTPDESTEELSQDGRVPRYARYVDARDACSACYGSLMYAIDRKGEGWVRRLGKPFRVGQAYRGKSQDGIGIGACCAGCPVHVPGCPPSAREIIEALEELD
jgi:uncharacterized protein (DUF362 family)